MRPQAATTAKRRRNDLTLVEPQPQPAPVIKAIARDDVERRAYERFLERGGADGGDVEDWLEAERELLSSRPDGS